MLEVWILINGSWEAREVGKNEKEMWDLIFVYGEVKSLVWMMD